MKITIYELLGMIKDGNAPKKIIYRNVPMIYNKGVEDYIPHQTDKFHGNDLLHYLFEEETKKFLNDIVEILEEENKIPEKLELPSFVEFKTMSPEARYVVTAKEYDVLNDIIDYLKSKGNE